MPLTGEFKLFFTPFFPNGKNLSIAEVKSNALHLTVPVIHLQEINCQALKHFSSWVILGTCINSVAGSQHFCLVFLLVVKHCSSFYVAAFICIFNNRIINFLLPLSWWPFCSLSSSCVLRVSAAVIKWEAALDRFEYSTTFCLRNMILGTDKAAVKSLFHRCTWHDVKPFSTGNSWNKYVIPPQKNSRLRKKNDDEIKSKQQALLNCILMFIMPFQNLAHISILFSSTSPHSLSWGIKCRGKRRLKGPRQGLT